MGWLLAVKTDPDCADFTFAGFGNWSLTLYRVKLSRLYLAHPYLTGNRGAEMLTSPLIFS
jgi:hypothetical protein